MQEIKKKKSLWPQVTFVFFVSDVCVTMKAFLPDRMNMMVAS